MAIAAAPWPYGSSGDSARYSIALVQLAACLAWALQRARAGVGLPALAIPALGLPALALGQLCLGWSAAPQWTGEALLLLAGSLATMLFWSDQARDSRSARRLALVIVLVCAAQAVFGAVKWSLNPLRLEGEVGPVLTLPFGSFVNHNHFAGFVEIGVLLAAGMALGEARRHEAAAVAWASASLGLAAVHLASRSRGGLVGLAGGVAVLVALAPFAGERSRRGVSLLRRAGIMAVAGVGLLGFGLAVIPTATRQHLATILQGASDASGTYRLDIYAATLRLALAHPLVGSGLGAYADAFPAFKQGHGALRTTHGESDALEVLAETGVLGLLALLWLARAVWQGLAQRLREGHDPARKGLAIGAAAAVGALLAHSLLDFNLRLPANALLFSCVLGLAASPRSERLLPRSRVPIAVLSVLAALTLWRAVGAVALDSALAPRGASVRVTALAPVLSWHPYLSSGYRSRAVAWSDLAYGDPRMAPARLLWAARDLEHALALRPAWAEAWASVGNVRLRQGDLVAAGTSFARAVALDPTYPAVSLAYAAFLARSSPEAGISELLRLRRADPAWSLAVAKTHASRWTSDPVLLSRLAEPE